MTIREIRRRSDARPVRADRRLERRPPIEQEIDARRRERRRQDGRLGDRAARQGTRQANFRCSVADSADLTYQARAMPITWCRGRTSRSVESTASSGRRSKADDLADGTIESRREDGQARTRATRPVRRSTRVDDEDQGSAATVDCFAEIAIGGSSKRAATGISPLVVLWKHDHVQRSRRAPAREFKVRNWCANARASTPRVDPGEDRPRALPDCGCDPFWHIYPTLTGTSAASRRRTREGVSLKPAARRGSSDRRATRRTRWRPSTR